MKIIKQLERILKVYYEDPNELKRRALFILHEFEEQGYCQYFLTKDESIILLRDERRPPFRLRKFLKSPFPYLSNMEYFGLESGPWNEELAAYGIKCRSKYGDYPHSKGGSRIHLIQHWSLNNRCNQYLKQQYKRLLHYRTSQQYHLYWKLSYHLMLYSWSFKLACFNNWCPRWYKELSLKTYQSIWSGLKTILEFKELRTIVQNVWIESPKGKWRQLGIPPQSWRLYLHMLNMFLSYLFEPSLSSETTHGFVFNRGCKSWWESLLWGNYLTRFQWIYEVDLTSGFPNLSRHGVREALKSSGLVPEKFQNLILLPLTSPLKESQTFPTLSTYIENQENQFWRHSDRSVHMGLGISPILFVITLDWVFKSIGFEHKEMKYKAYCDDLSFYFNSNYLPYFQILSGFSKLDLLIEILSGRNPLMTYFNNHPLMKKTGLQFCQHKSSLIRAFGIWLKPFRSLGLSLYCPTNYETQMSFLYDGKQPSLHLKAHTRGRGLNPITGKASTLPSHTKLSDLNSGTKPSIEFSHLLSDYRKYFGFFLSKLYGGKASLYKPHTWKHDIKRYSPLGQLLFKHQINSTLGKLEQWTVYNSGSKMNKLLLGLISGESEAKWFKRLDKGLYKQLYLNWKIPLDVLENLRITNPLPPYQDHPFPENESFNKLADLQLSEERIKEYSMMYEKMQKLPHNQTKPQ